MLPLTDPILVFMILALCILAAPVLARKLRIPDLVLLLTFGATLGPHGLHILERSTAVKLLGAVGLLYIMFLAGLEIDLYRFSRTYKRSIGFGLMTFLIPEIFGALAGRYILGLDWSASVLLASMFASHTLLAYPLAGRLGISRTEPVAITVGATIITDTLALLVLAIIADAARGIPLSSAFWATIIFGMLGLTVLIWKGVPYASRWFFQRVTEESNAQFLFVLVAMCGCAYLSHFARMEPIIGAFLAGAAFNRLIPENSPLMSRVTFAGNTLFIPFFLISTGMLVDVGAMFTGAGTWMVGATMIVMVVLTKYAAAQVASRSYGYSRASGQVMFGLSVVQAAATLAAVVIGHELKIFDSSVLNGAILMILVTCPLGSWMVDRYGRRMAVETPSQMPSARGEQRLLVVVSDHETAGPLLDLSFFLRNAAVPGGVYPLKVVTDQGDTEDAVARAENLLGYCLAYGASADIAVNPGLRLAMNVSDGIIHAAQEVRASTVVTRWQAEYSASIRIFGSPMQHLVERCASRLLFSRLVRPLNTTKRLLVLFPPRAIRRDIEPFIRDAKTLAHRIGSELRTYAITDESDLLQQAAEDAKPACPVTTQQAATWEAARDRLISEIAANDTLMLPLDRRGGLAWTPGLDRLPELVSDRFPNNNLLVDYPSLPSLDQEFREEIVRQDEDLPMLLPVDIDENHTLEQTLQRLVEIAYPGRPGVARGALERLLESAASYAVELAPGVVLLHARWGDNARPLLMVCHARQGWQMAGLPDPARIILVLLGAQTQAPDQHLRVLSRIANWIIKAGQNPEFQSAQNAAEICTFLKDNDT